MDLKGLGVAMVTPFTPEGQIDCNAIPAVVENITTGRGRLPRNNGYNS